jgi:uncharacterized membrane protein YbaN (DUF454 family)
MRVLMKWIYNVGGGICVGLAFLGIFLPLLPTTPFLLLAALCFSRGSTRMHRWLKEHRLTGPILKDWEENRVIRPRVKRTAAIMIILVMIPALLFGSFPLFLKLLSAAVGCAVIAMLYSYPSRPKIAPTGAAKTLSSAPEAERMMPSESERR